MTCGTKYPQKIIDSSKVAPVMFTENAEGNVLPPYILYKSVNLYDQWVKKRSMEVIVVAFTGWFFTMMPPKLHREEGKKVLIGDIKMSNIKVHFQKSISTNSWKLSKFSTLISKLGENNASGENQVSSFYKGSIYPFTPTPVLETLPSKISTSTQKILDASLSQQHQQIRESPICDMPLAEKKKNSFKCCSKEVK